MHFEITQRLAAPVAEVADALTDPAYYARLGELPKLGRPEVLDRTADGDIVRLQVRYRFAGDLSPAARAVLDPEKLTWVEHSVHDLAVHRVRFELRPDHYADRFTAQGGYELVPADTDATERRAQGEVKVRAPLVGGSVERAIVSGLREHLDAEVAVLEAYVTG